MVHAIKHAGWSAFTLHSQGETRRWSDPDVGVPGVSRIGLANPAAGAYGLTVRPAMPFLQRNAPPCPVCYRNVGSSHCTGLRTALHLASDRAAALIVITLPWPGWKRILRSRV